MLYRDGRVVVVGDLVDLAPRTDGIVKDAWVGTVVCVFDDLTVLPGYEDWTNAGLQTGCLVSCKGAGLIHFENADDDFAFLGRAD